MGSCRQEAVYVWARVDKKLSMCWLVYTRSCLCVGSCRQEAVYVLARVDKKLSMCGLV